jgi:hypothetical protein
MRLVDRYEEELVEAARRLREKPSPGRRAVARARGVLAWTPAVALIALGLAISAVVSTGGREGQEARGAGLMGWYASPFGSGQPLPKGAPRGSSLRLGGDGRYRLTTDIYRVSGQYRVDNDTLEFVAAGRYEFLPTFRTNMVRLPDASPCRAALGFYRVVERRGSINFELVRDPCRPRASVVSRGAWRRVGR